MRNSILKIAGSSQRLINLLPQTAHSATTCGQTGCEKTVFILDLLEGPYRGFFQHIVVLCPTVMLSILTFSGRHAEQTVWVLTQKYNSVLKDLREQTRWVCLFHCKDRDSFEDCQRENDAIPSREQLAFVRQQLAEAKHAKLLLKTDQPVCYTVLSDFKQ